MTTFGDALNPGLSYVASNDALSSDTGGLFLEFQFRVSTNSGASLIKDNSLEVGVNDFFFGGDGFFTIDEDVFKDDQFSSPVLDEFGGDVFKQVAADSTGNNLLFQNVNFLSQQSEIFVDTRILLELAPGPLSGITQFEQRFSQVQAAGGVIPEPGTFSLLGIGLAGLALHQWRRKKWASQ